MAVKASVYRIGSLIPGASAATLGGKAFGLQEMSLAGIPVPPAYVIDVEACRSYMVDPEGVMAWVRESALPTIKAGLTEAFGYMPLVSVRSGAPISMPGMLDTILNVGLDPATYAGWEKRLGAECAADCFSRLQHMYGSVVGGDTLPTSADEQIVGAIEAVFKSWNNERAVDYRKLNAIPEDMGTAVVVQAMVFANLNERSGTGVAFSRDYSTGENKATGNWKATVNVGGKMVYVQGEDLVAGGTNAPPLSTLMEWDPAIGAQLLEVLDKLELIKRDMVDTEFTVQDGKLYMLQVRVGARCAQAALKIAVDLFQEKVITLDEVLGRVTFRQFLAAGRPVIPEAWIKANAAHGIGALDNAGMGASVGAASGVAVFSKEAAINCTEPCILIRPETTPADFSGMSVAMGILTASGGHTSHAAVVARSLDKVCVVGCSTLTQVGDAWVLSDGKIKRTIKEGTKVTLDGATASIWVGADVPIEGGKKSDYESKFLDLLAARYDFYRTVTAASELNGAKKVLLATYALDRKFSGLALMAEVTDLLEAADGRDIVLDLRTFDQVCREADKPLELLWGAASSISAVVDFKIRAIKEAFSAGVKVLELGLTAKQIDEVKAAGFTVVPVVNTLTELLAVKGLCIANFEGLVKSASKEEVLRIIDLKKAAGEAVHSFNIVEQVSPELLSRNAVFALSAMQAAQCLLAAGKGA
jgi:phosphohistidine swiveling domain-containing protein